MQLDHYCWHAQMRGIPQLFRQSGLRICPDVRDFAVHINSGADSAHYQAAPVAAGEQQVGPSDRALSLAGQFFRVKFPLIARVYYGDGDEIKTRFRTTASDNIL